MPGNHEFYHYDISRFQGSVTTKIFDSITLVNNKTIVYKDINFIFTTLWGRITPPNELYIRDNISDFHVIMKRGAALTPAHFNAMHEASVGFLESELQNSKHEKNVVITHHVPTLLNYPEEYRRSRLNQAFVIEMHDFICAHPIDYWIFGHHHVNIPSFTIGKTRLVTNQLGYVHHNEHRDFDRCAIFEV
ncbi:MAG: metallophosphoesterase [Bacteroidia bacterium]|nr:metallophosphoesterase [Bacteroidia bacterium]